MALVKQESADKVLRVPSAEEIATQIVGGQSTSSSQTVTLLGLPVELQALVTPLLYKNMELSVECLDEVFSSTLKASHAGLLHVQTLCIRTPNRFWDDICDVEAAILCRLLFTIPTNSLTMFE
jgi:hypothetical protein